MAPPEKAGGAQRKADSQEVDGRFAAVSTDPRFRRFPKKEGKVKIDERFSGTTDHLSASHGAVCLPCESLGQAVPSHSPFSGGWVQSSSY